MRKIAISLFVLCLMLMMNSVTAVPSGNYYKEITIDHNYVNGLQTDFPMMINITDGDLVSKAQLDSDDIVFYSGDHITQLDHEIELYNPSTGQLVAWVRIPSLSNTTDTVINMYYNNSSATNTENPSGVWGVNASGIWLMNEGTGTVVSDSSGNGNHGFNSGADWVAGGLDFNGTSDYMEVSAFSPDMVTTKAYTIAYRLNTTQSGGFLWNVRHVLIYNGTDGFGIAQNESGKIFVYTAGGNTVAEAAAGTTINDGQNHTIVAVFDQVNDIVSVYVDGILDYQVTSYTDSSSTIDAKLYVGCEDEYTNNYDGIFEYIHIYDRALSAGEVGTRYNNTNSTSTFSTVGAEQTKAAGNAPNITSWSNTKTNDALLDITVNISEDVKFNGTANQSDVTWIWYIDGEDKSHNYDNFTFSWTSSGSKTVIMNVTNSNGTSDPVQWDVTVQQAAGNAPNITSWSNNKTNDALLDITVNIGEDVKFNGTANQSDVTWIWYVDGEDKSHNYDNFTFSWTSSGSKTVIVNVTNSNGTSDPVQWNVIVSQAAGNAPNITSWSNTKTNDKSLDITVDISEDVKFNGTANQSDVTWIWYVDGVDKSHDYDNFTFNWTSSGSKTVIVNVTNSNGTSDPVRWNVIVSQAAGNAPNITSWSNTKTNDKSLDITVDISEDVKFNGTANQSDVTWIWYVDGVDKSHDYDNFTFNWTSSGSKTVIVNVTNSNGTSDPVQWNVIVSQAAGNAPNITSWSNTKTNDKSLDITVDISEDVKFNGTANQSDVTWIWYVDGVDKSHDYDNFTFSWTSSGSKTVIMNVTNSNGTSDPVQWDVTVQQAAGAGNDLEFVNITIDGIYSIIFANHSGSTTEGNWISLSGGDPIELPSPFTLTYNGTNFSTSTNGNISVTVDVENNTDYVVTYPHTTHDMFTNVSGKNNVNMCFNGTTYFANNRTDVYLINISVTSLKDAFNPITYGDVTGFYTLLGNAYITKRNESLDDNGDMNLNFGEVNAGDYAIFILLNNSDLNKKSILSATTFQVLEYESTTTVLSPEVTLGDTFNANITLTNAPTGTYTYEAMLVHESAYYAEMQFKFNGTRAGTNLTLNDVYIIEGYEVLGVGLSSVNITTVLDTISDGIDANNGSVKNTTIDANNASVAFDTGDLRAGNYILLTGVYNSGDKLVAFNQSEILISTDTTAPVITNATADPLAIEANGTDYAWLNVTATDPSGIDSVSINLSAIGGLPAQEMNNGTDGVWSFHASTTVSGMNGTLINLPLNVTDRKGNSNTSCNIALGLIDKVEVSAGNVTSFNVSVNETILNVTIFIPAGTNLSSGMVLTVAPVAPPSTFGFEYGGLAVDLNGLDFNKSITITIEYLDTTQNQEKLRLWFYNTTEGEWEMIEGSTVNTTACTVSGNVSHFTIFSPMADITPPTISITSPASGSTTTASSITVSGHVDGIGSTPTVIVNGYTAALDLVDYAGTYSVSIPLSVIGTNTITAIATDAFDNKKSTSITVTRKSTSSGGGGGSSGGGGGSSGGGGASGEEFENILISETERENVFKNSKVSYSFDMEGNIVRYINFTGLTNAGRVAAKVEILNHTSTLVEHAPADIVYKNLNIFVGNLGWATSKNIANPTVRFEVEKSWISENNIDRSTITLNRYSGDKWNPVLTTMICEYPDYLYFESQVPGFSPFAVTGKTIGGGGVTPTETGVSPTGTATSTPTEEKPGIPGFEAIGALGMITVVYCMYRRRG